MSIAPSDLHGILDFLRAAEALKHTTRVAWTSTGQQESVAEHTWRLCLMALVLAPRFPGVDVGKLLRICIVHDLGEAIGGDISAKLQVDMPAKAEQERKDLLQLTEPLPAHTRAEIIALWDEYEQAASLEARIAKGLDKLETILQHNQGAMPDDFDFRFNLQYGSKYTTDDPILRTIRAVLDEETERRARESDRRQSNATRDHAPEGGAPRA
jgi:putative hydrolase of HD superfamily